VSNFRKTKKVSLSVLVPCFNEEKNLDAFLLRTEKTLSKITNDYEIIFVDDGSTDQTLQTLTVLSENNLRIKIVALARNFGKETALTAGLDFVTKDLVVPIDADLQDPPELIPEMVSLWREGNQVVYAKRKNRKGESFLKKFTSELFYKILNSLSEIEIPTNTGDFRLIDRTVLEDLKKINERNRFMKGIFAWVGHRQTYLEYNRDERYAGSTKFNYPKLWKLAIEGITSFSTFPLTLCTYLGLLVSCMTFAYGLFVFVKTMICGVEKPGYASLIIIILFLGGVQLLSLGIIGEYLGKIYLETKQRPLYTVSRTYGFGT